MNTKMQSREVLNQLEHRLLALEAELKEKARGGTIGQGAFMRRLKRLGKAHEDVSALRRVLLSGIGEERNEATAELTGLPSLETLTPPERTMCEEHLEARADGDDALADEAETIHLWLDEAVRGRVLILGSMFRMSKLKKLIEGHERRRIVLDATGDAQEKHAEKLVAAFGDGGKRRDFARSTLDRLVSLYRELDQAIVRVARLRGAYRNEEARATKLAGMIRAKRQTLVDATVVPHFPPPPSELLRARDAAEKIVAPHLFKARKRRATIERFWEDVMGRPPAQPTDGQMSAAKRAMGTKAPESSSPDEALEDIWRRTRAELRRELTPLEPGMDPIFDPGVETLRDDRGPNP